MPSFDAFTLDSDWSLLGTFIFVTKAAYSYTLKNNRGEHLQTLLTLIISSNPRLKALRVSAEFARDSTPDIIAIINQHCPSVENLHLSKHNTSHNIFTDAGTYPKNSGIHSIRAEDYRLSSIYVYSQDTQLTACMTPPLGKFTTLGMPEPGANIFPSYWCFSYVYLNNSKLQNLQASQY